MSCVLNKLILVCRFDSMLPSGSDASPVPIASAAIDASENKDEEKDNENVSFDKDATAPVVNTLSSSSSSPTIHVDARNLPNNNHDASISSVIASSSDRTAADDNVSPASPIVVRATAGKTSSSPHNAMRDLFVFRSAQRPNRQVRMRMMMLIHDADSIVLFQFQDRIRQTHRKTHRLPTHRSIRRTPLHRHRMLLTMRRSHQLQLLPSSHLSARLLRLK